MELCHNKKISFNFKKNDLLSNNDVDLGTKKIDFYICEDCCKCYTFYNNESHNFIEGNTKDFKKHKIEIMGNPQYKDTFDKTEIYYPNKNSYIICWKKGLPEIWYNQKKADDENADWLRAR